MKSYTHTAHLLKVRCVPIRNFIVSGFKRSRVLFKTFRKHCQDLGKQARPHLVRSGKFLKAKSQPALRYLNRKIDQSRPFSKYWEGPARLFTARFNRRNALFMIALCTPALSLTALLTLPGFLFYTPQHNEYFEFARELNYGGDHWVALGLSACCTFFCFAMPCEDYPADQSNKA